MSQPYRTIQLQRDTAANWTSANTLLAEGELGLEIDTRKAKIGNGVTNWNLLPYAFSGFIENDVVLLEGDQTIDGVKTFSSSPIVPTPTTGTQASNKDYSDSLNPDFYQYSIVRSVKNLIANNSFETDLSGWSGWLSASFTRVTSQSFSGTASAQVVTDGSTYAQGCYAAVTTKVGFQYAYSVYVKGTAGKQITMLIDGGTAPEYYQTLTGGWDRITGSVTATTTNTSIYIQCRTAGVTTYWVDAVQVEEGTTTAGPFTTTQGNLTVALKNYEGNDPTPTKPVKIMIGGVVRTITSALSIEIPGGIVPFFNSGSTELAGKEIDYFTTVIYDDGTSSVRLGITRAMLGNIFSDWIAPSVNQVSERVMYDSLFNNSGGNISATSQVVNIGRFNATLSAGLTWSIPATSVIVNSPTQMTRALLGGSQTGWTANNLLFYYTINGDRVDFSFDANGTSNSTSSYITLPFSAKTLMAHDFALGLTYDNGVDLTTPGRADLYGQYINLYKDSAYGAWTASGAKIIRGQGHYYI